MTGDVFDVVGLTVVVVEDCFDGAAKATDLTFLLEAAAAAGAAVSVALLRFRFAMLSSWGFDCDCVEFLQEIYFEILHTNKTEPQVWKFLMELAHWRGHAFWCQAQSL